MPVAGLLAVAVVAVVVVVVVLEALFALSAAPVSLALGSSWVVGFLAAPNLNLGEAAASLPFALSASVPLVSDTAFLVPGFGASQARHCSTSSGFPEKHDEQCHCFFACAQMSIALDQSLKPKKKKQQERGRKQKDKRQQKTKDRRQGWWKTVTATHMHGSLS